MSRVENRVRRALTAALCACAFTLFSGEAGASENYVLFESGQVRPIALSPNGKLLFAVNTPDDRLEIFRVAGRNPEVNRGHESLTFTCVPLRTGYRIGVDRDDDGVRDGDDHHLN